MVNSTRPAGVMTMSVCVNVEPFWVPSCEFTGAPSRPTIVSGCAFPS